MSTVRSNLPMSRLPFLQAQTSWWGHLLWVLAASVIGWAVTTLFAGILRWPRDLLLVPYVLLSIVFMVGYLRWSGLNLWAHLVHNWGWGLVGAALAGWFVVQNVLSQPRTPMPQGLDLVFNVLWLGVVYGLVDGLLLSVLPVAATWQACKLLGWTNRWSGRISAGVLALAASLLVTAAYHLGYPEFQGVEVLGPVFGVGVMSLAYLVSRSPLAPVLSHVAMHVAAVLYGLYTAIQLPPHY